MSPNNAFTYTFKLGRDQLLLSKCFFQHLVIDLYNLYIRKMLYDVHISY